MTLTAATGIIAITTATIVIFSVLFIGAGFRFEFFKRVSGSFDTEYSIIGPLYQHYGHSITHRPAFVRPNPEIFKSIMGLTNFSLHLGQVIMLLDLAMLLKNNYIYISLK